MLARGDVNERWHGYHAFVTPGDARLGEKWNVGVPYLLVNYYETTPVDPMLERRPRGLSPAMTRSWSDHARACARR